jgi:hypothetical protein
MILKCRNQIKRIIERRYGKGKRWGRYVISHHNLDDAEAADNIELSNFTES